MTRAFAAVGSVMKAADYGSGANESVFLRTSVGNRGVEKMDSIDIQDARFVVPSNQVKALTIWNLNGSDLVTMVMGGGTSVLRLLDSTMTGVCAA